MQRHPSPELVTCGAWSKLPWFPTVAPHSESPVDLDSSSRTSSWVRQTSSERCTNASNSGRTRRRSSPSSERVWESVVSTTSCGFTATQSCRNRAAEVYDEIGQRSLERFFTGPHKKQHDADNPRFTSVQNWVQKSARHRGLGTSGGSHRSHTVHPGSDPRRRLNRPSPGADPGGAPL